MNSGATFIIDDIVFMLYNQSGTFGGSNILEPGSNILEPQNFVFNILERNEVRKF